MKKVWILERFESNEMLVKQLNELKQTISEHEAEFTDEMKATAKETIATLQRLVDENPNGYWSGWEGKAIYHQFCDVAKDALRRADKSWKFRVIEGEVEDDAKYWAGYKVVKENKGVLRYLMATK